MFLAPVKYIWKNQPIIPSICVETCPPLTMVSVSNKIWNMNIKTEPGRYDTYNLRFMLCKLSGLNILMFLVREFRNGTEKKRYGFHSGSAGRSELLDIN